jgi:hypothetical protein
VFECEQLYIDTHCHGKALHCMSAFHALYCEWQALCSFLSISQYPCEVVVLCCLSSTISTPFLSRTRQQLPTASIASIALAAAWF